MNRIEILTVGLIIGAVGLASGYAVLSARSHERDVTRLAHVRELQLGLELFFSNNGAYPQTSEAIALGEPTTACLSADGFAAPCAAAAMQSPYVEFVPAPPVSGLSGKSTCSGIKNAYCYSSDSTSFKIQFELEQANSTLGLVKGANCATESGFVAGACTAY